MWGTWFGGSGGQKRKDAPKKAILDLRQQLDMLQKREKHLENQMAEQEAIAKKNITTNKTAARNALKRKKAHENSLEQTSAQISMLENQIYAIESANINQETLLAMKNASKAMKDIHGTLTIDKVDEIMENLGEHKALADEIANAIAHGPHSGDPIDEGELEDDLARLEQEDLDEKMLKTGTVPVLPTGPNGERKSSPPPLIDTVQADMVKTANDMVFEQLVKGKSRVVPEEEENEEEELRKLQAEMAM